MGTASFAEAIFKSCWRVAAAACRNCGPARSMVRLPAVTPWSTVFVVSPTSMWMTEGHIQLFGDDLRERGFDAGAQVHFAGEDGHFAVAADGDPGVQRAGLRLVVASARCAGRHLRQHVGNRIEKIEGNNQGAGALEDLPARNCLRVDWRVRVRLRVHIGVRRHFHIGVHVQPPHALTGSPAARFTARITRRWLPQRHRFPLRACLISSSLGCAFLSRSTFATRIIPFMQ